MTKTRLYVGLGTSLGLYLIGLAGIWGTGSRWFLLPLVLLPIPLGLLYFFIFKEQKEKEMYLKSISKIVVQKGRSLIEKVRALFPEAPEVSNVHTRLSDATWKGKDKELQEKNQAPGKDQMQISNELLHLVESLCTVMHHVVEQYGAEKEKLQSSSQKAKQYKERLQSLCSIHVPVELTDKWQQVATNRWDAVSSDTLDSLSHIKEMEDSSSRFVQEVIHQFKRQQNSYEVYTESYQESLKEYFAKVEGIRDAYIRDLDTSTQEVQNAFSQFQQITDIVGRIKLISLNMSIEASKVKGSSAFGLLARELRRLAEHTEDTLKRISQRIQSTLQEVAQNKEKQIQEFATIIGVIDHFKEISTKYDKTTIEMTKYIDLAIHQIESNQEQERAMLMRFFQNLQNIAIYKEELSHLIQYQKAFLEKTNGLVQEIVREDKLCRGVGCPDRKEALELLASFVTTDQEREFINQLFKEYLDIDREEAHGKLQEASEGVVLF
ncbi:MAG: methyl-accepting chemotaxis protein [Spirochaetales bacterium]